MTKRTAKDYVSDYLGKFLGYKSFFDTGMNDAAWEIWEKSGGIEMYDIHCKRNDFPIYDGVVSDLNELAMAANNSKNIEDLLDVCEKVYEYKKKFEE